MPLRFKVFSGGISTKTSYGLKGPIGEAAPMIRFRFYFEVLLFGVYGAVIRKKPPIFSKQKITVFWGHCIPSRKKSPTVPICFYYALKQSHIGRFKVVLPVQTYFSLGFQSSRNRRNLARCLLVSEYRACRSRSLSFIRLCSRATSRLIAKFC